MKVTLPVQRLRQRGGFDPLDKIEVEVSLCEEAWSSATLPERRMMLYHALRDVAGDERTHLNVEAVAKHTLIHCDDLTTVEV